MSKPTILLVDDEERILRSLRMLFFSGYNVHMTTDANEAIQILRDEKVHVIVSDQRMPIMLGAELLRIARETSPATMRILLTGYSDLEASIACVNEGEVYRYLMKPWDAEEVRSTVAEAAAIAEASFNMQQTQALAATAPTPAGTNQKVRVLVMDNDETTAVTVNEVLGDRAEVIWAADMQHAMEILAQEDVAIVVTDLMMEGKNISYVLKTIKQYNPKTQSIVVTSFNDTSHLIDLINQAQIARYLPKPLRKNILARNLEYLIDRFNSLCQLPVLQHRQSVAPINDTEEKTKSGGLMDMLNRLRARNKTAEQRT